MSCDILHLQALLLICYGPDALKVVKIHLRLFFFARDGIWAGTGRSILDIPMVQMSLFVNFQSRFFSLKKPGFNHHHYISAFCYQGYTFVCLYPKHIKLRLSQMYMFAPYFIENISGGNQLLHINCENLKWTSHCCGRCSRKNMHYSSLRMDVDVCGQDDKTAPISFISSFIATFLKFLPFFKICGWPILEHVAHVIVLERAIFSWQ